MSATDELRRLLDERGIEWWSKPRLVVGGVERGTEFDAADGRWVCAIEALDGTICVSHLTPEQAVTVTMGDADATSARQSVADLKDENAKLRELVKHYHRLVTGTDELWSWQSVYAELQELGIEVKI